MLGKLNKFKKYKFTDKKRSKGGIVSSLLFFVSAALFFAGVREAYKSDGNGGIEVGVMAMSSLLVSLLGFYVGIRSFKEENVFFGYSWLGTVGNTVMWIILGGMILVGL